MNKILKIIAIVFLALVVTVGVIGAVIVADLASYTCTGSKTLSPDGAPAGKALVVYSPGLSGAAQRAAETIAEDLQSRGYLVDLAGIHSSPAAQASSYDVVVAGGPMYWGAVSSSVDAYLKELNLPSQTTLGIYGTTGSSEYSSNDFGTLKEQVASATAGPAAITLVLNGNETQNCADFVTALLK